MSGEDRRLLCGIDEAQFSLEPPIAGQIGRQSCRE
jgi:hypothetical protein